MNRFFFLFIVVLSSGCTAIGGYNYHGISDSPNFMDCGEYLGEPSLGQPTPGPGPGGVWKITGAGNFTEINVNGNDILVCSRGFYKDSLYLLGLLFPIIPWLGLGSSEVPPQEIEFSIFNRSYKKEIIFNADTEYEWCILKFRKTNRCKEYEYGKKKLELKIPTNSVLNLKINFRDEYIFRIKLENGSYIDISFKEVGGTFFVLIL